MLRFVARRLLQVVPTLLILSVLLFAWLRSLPGGPAGALLGDKARPRSRSPHSTRRWAWTNPSRSSTCTTSAGR